MTSLANTAYDLTNKTILITGAGDGIGEAVALAAAKQGANIILLGRTVAKLERTYDDILALNNGTQPSIVPLDLQGATPDHYQQLGQTISEQYGHLDGLVNNAAMLGTLSPFSAIDLEEYQQVMQVNVHAQLYLTQALLPVLLKAPNPSVIFTSSTVGHEGRALWGSYSISKFALEGMAQVLADEYKHKHLRVNVINPGATRTAMRAKAYPAENTALLKAPADVVDNFLFLLANDSIGTTKQRLDC